MATRLYFHDAANGTAGTLPAAEQSSLTPSLTMTNAGTCKLMNSLTGTAMVTGVTITSSATLAHRAFLRTFGTTTFNVDQVILPQIYTLNMAIFNSDALMNFGPGFRMNLYVWTPGTGTKRASIVDNLAFIGFPDPGAIALCAAEGSYSSSVTVTAIAGDILVCEVWSVFTPASITSYKASVAYDGTTVNSTDLALVTNHASFLNMATSTLTFGTPAAATISGSFAQTMAAATVAGTGKIALSGSAAFTLAAATVAGTGKIALSGSAGFTLAAATVAGTGRVAVSGSAGFTLANATVAATGTVAGPFTYGNRGVTLDAATVAATGRVATSAAFSATLAAATLSGTGAVGVLGNGAKTLAAATLSATGEVDDPPIITGSFNVTLDSIMLTANGTVGSGPPVPAPVLPSDNSGGSGHKRKRFVIPDPHFNPVRTLDDILGLKEDDRPKVKELPPTPVESLTLAAAVAANPPAKQHASTLPNSSPVVVEEEEYSDEDLMHLLLVLTP